SRRRHTSFSRDWSSDVCSSDLWELALDDRKVKRGRRYDLVIVDAPATGHGVGFLQTPRTFANVARVGPIAHQAKTLHRFITDQRSEEHTSELQSRENLVCRLLL